MNIIHISKVAGIAAAKSDIVFLYYSEEVRDKLLSVLHNAWHTWVSTAPLTNGPLREAMGIPGGIRISSHGVLHGSIEFYTDTLSYPTQYRVVL